MEGSSAGPLAISIHRKLSPSDKDWVKISDGDRVRITMAGKPLLVELIASDVVGPVDWRSLELTLEDVGSGISHRASEERTPNPTTWIFESSPKKARPESSSQHLYLRVKVFLHRTTVRFRATVKTQSGQNLTAKSPGWYPTASGPSKGKKKKVERHNSQKVELDKEKETPEPIGNSIPANLNVQGTVSAFGYVMFSDLRLKDDIMELQNAHKAIASLRGCRFRWRDGHPESLESDAAMPNPRTRRIIGLIAQDVYATAPECVSKLDNGILAVDYASIAPLLVEALKSQMAAASSLDRKEIKEMEEVNLQIQKLIIDLRSFVEVIEPTPPSRPAAPPSVKTQRSVRIWSWDRIFTLQPAFLVFPLVFLLLVAIAASILAAVLPVSPLLIQPPPTNQTFKPTNFLVNGGFEEPNLAWVGSGLFQSYQDSTDSPGPTMKLQANFDAGSRFMLLNSSSNSAAFIRQSNAVPTSGWATLTLSVQTFIVSLSTTGASTLSLSLSILDAATNRIKCPFEKNMTVSAIGRWELLSMTYSCLLAPNDLFTVNFISWNSRVGLDDAQLYLASIFQPDLSSVGRFINSTSVEIRPRFMADVSGEFSCRMTEYAAPEQFLLSFAKPLLSPSDLLDVGVLVVSASGSWDTSFGTSGVALAPGVRQTQSNIHFQWTAVDSQNRIILVGSYRVGEGSLRAVVTRLTPQGNIDSTFGNGGVRSLSLDSYGNETGAAVFIAHDDSIVVLIRLDSVSSFALAKLNQSGDVDFSFGDASFFSMIPFNVSSIDISPSGRIAIVASTIDNSIVLVYNSSGALDDSFGNLGSISLWPNNTVGLSPIATTVKIYMDGGLLVLGGENSSGQMDPFAFKFDAIGNLVLDYTPFLPRSTLANDFVLHASIASDASVLFAIQQSDTTFFVSLRLNGSVDNNAFGGSALNLPNSIHGISSTFTWTSLDTVVVTSKQIVNNLSQGVYFVSSTTSRIAIARPWSFPPLLPPTMTAEYLVATNTEFYVAGNAYVNFTQSGLVSVPALFIASHHPTPGTSGELILPTSPLNTTEHITVSLFVNPASIIYVAQRRLRNQRVETLIERRLSSETVDPDFSQDGQLFIMKDIVALKMTNADAAQDGEVFCAGITSTGLLWIGAFNSNGALRISYEVVFEKRLTNVRAVQRFEVSLLVLLNANDSSSILVHLDATLSIKKSIQFADSFLSCMVVVPELQFIYLAGTTLSGSGTYRSSTVKKLLVSNSTMASSWPSIALTLGANSTVDLSHLWWDQRRFRLVGMGTTRQSRAVSRVFVVTIDPITSQADCTHVYPGGLRRLFPAEDGFVDAVPIHRAYATLLQSSISSAVRIVSESVLDQCLSLCDASMLDLTEDCE